MNGQRRHKGRTRNGYEHDAVTAWRHVYNWGPGKLAFIKRGLNRRLRRDSRADTAEDFTVSMDMAAEAEAQFCGRNCEWCG